MKISPPFGFLVFQICDAICFALVFANKHYLTEILTGDFNSLVMPVYKCTLWTPGQSFASSVQSGTAVLSRVLVWSKGQLKDTLG